MIFKQKLNKKGFVYWIWGLLGLLALVTLLVAVIAFCFWSHNLLQELVLFWTLLAIVGYSFETYRLRDETYRVAEATIALSKETKCIAEQTIEANLRPIILRTGLNLSWKFRSIENSENENSALMEIQNLKNIATDIQGHIVLGGKKYPLLFGRDFSSGNQSSNEMLKQITFPNSFKWQWLPSGGLLYVSYYPDKYEESTSGNEIYLEYRDVEGNKYYTRESSDYIQKTGKL